MLKKIKLIIGYMRFYLKKFLFKNSNYNKINNEQLRLLRKNGYVVIPNYYDAQKCQELRAKIDLYIEKYKGTERLWTDKVGADNRLFSSEEIDDVFKEFFNDPFLQDMADNYFEAKMTNTNTLAARIDAVEGNIGSGQGWHRDSNFFQFKSIIYLSDVSIENGPFQIFEGSHKFKNVIEDMNIMNSNPLAYRIPDEQIDKLLVVKGESKKNMVAPMGTLLLADTSTLHTGMPIQEGSRYTLFNYFVPSYYNKKETLKHIREY